MIVTDSNIPDKIAHAIEDRGVELHIVDVTGTHKPSPTSQPFDNPGKEKIILS